VEDIWGWKSCPSPQPPEYSGLQLPSFMCWAPWRTLCLVWILTQTPSKCLRNFVIYMVFLLWSLCKKLLYNISTTLFFSDNNGSGPTRRGHRRGQRRGTSAGGWVCPQGVPSTDTRWDPAIPARTQHDEEQWGTEGLHTAPSTTRVTRSSLRTGLLLLASRLSHTVCIVRCVYSWFDVCLFVFIL